MSVDIWTLLEADAPAGCESIKDLYHWSLNYEAGQGPFALFLDMIGWSSDHIGCDIWSGKYDNLGYMEFDYLGQALMDYADNPLYVTDYIDALMKAEVAD